MNLSRRTWMPGLPYTRTLHPLVGMSRRVRLGITLEGLLLWLGIWAALTLSLPGEYGRLEVGQPSPLSIQAPRDVTYISEVLTAERQAQAENSPDNLVYTQDPAIPGEQLRALATLLDTITDVRETPNLTRSERLERMIALPSATVTITDAQAELILSIDDATWNELRLQTIGLYNRAIERYDYAIDERALAQLRERWLTFWLATTSLSPQQRDLSQSFADAFLRINRTVDDEATQERRRIARDQVQPQQVSVLAGENIVRVGEIVRPETIEKLQQTCALPRPLGWPGILGRGVLAALLAIGFIGYTLIFQPHIARQTRSLLVVVGLLVITLIAARLMLPMLREWPIAFPLATVAIIIAVVFNGRLSLASGLLLGITIGVMADNNLPLATTLLASCGMATFVARSADRLLTFLLAGLAVTVAIWFGFVAFWLIDRPDVQLEAFPPVLVPALLYSAMNGALSAILALGLFNLVSRVAGQVTPLQLMELAHPNQPLLRKLIREAPGSYYHSVNVGNLAEAAAEKLGADALLLRVAAYYHDIGKTIRPYFFTDNQVGRENVHSDLDPQTSAQIIVDHVREGVKMARAAGLPQQIIDFIATHHGTGVLKHFYQQALQEQDSVNINDFRYPGPRPQTREQAILMLADSVEATVRSKAQNGKLLPSRADDEPIGKANGGAQTLEDLVQSIIDLRVREGELDEAPLTMRELAQIRQVFVTSLQSIYHPRTDYAPQVIR
jgi:cyclic-di-AMP phosphodiesterase PgpH